MFTKDKKFTHLSYNERIKIEGMFKVRTPMKEIAISLERSLSTISRELKRGKVTLLNGSTYEFYTSYSADIAQKDYDDKETNKGVELKIGKNFKYINYIESKILNDKFSPAAAVNFAKQHCEFDISLSAPTIYRYVDMGFFVSLSNDDLAEGKRTIKHNKKNTHKTNTKNPLYESIEQRSEEINSRVSFGHWEMDCVVGKRKGKSTSLLVLTERLTRHEIIIKIKTRTASEVLKAINKLHRKYGKRFTEIFKTITVDNGGEFSDCAGIEKGGRTKMFYCHPYTSCERGSNERANRIIRRFIPKGTDISKYTNKDIQRIENWINSYPRKLFHWQCSDELYNNYISVIMQTA